MLIILLILNFYDLFRDLDEYLEKDLENCIKEIKLIISHR